jgi:hypothetical protein
VFPRLGEEVDTIGSKGLKPAETGDKRQIANFKVTFLIALKQCHEETGKPGLF